MKSSSWICCQLGAREHYAIPRAALRLEREVALITDVWAAPRKRWCLPQRWRQRFHVELSRVPVFASNSLAFGLETRMRLQGMRGWSAILKRNDWFQKMAERQLSKHIEAASDPPIVFVFSYAANRLLKTAKQLGCKTALGQIDPGPVEMEIVRRLDAESGGPQTEWPPDSYWDQWRQECELADCIVVNSHWSRMALIQEGIPESKLRVVPLAYETGTNALLGVESRLPEKFNAARPLQVLFLGQLISRKGVRELAQAIRRMKGAPIRWNLVGGADSATLAELRSLPQTHVPGAVSRKEAADYYRGADVFILPTHSDGFAITQLEAMSYGLPVVASTYCGEVAEHNRTGLILSEVSVDAIESAVCRLIEEPGLVNRLAAQVRVTPVRNLGDLANDLGEIEQDLT